MIFNVLPSSEARYHERRYGIISSTRSNLCPDSDYRVAGWRCVRHRIEDCFERDWPIGAWYYSVGLYASSPSCRLEGQPLGSMGDGGADVYWASCHDSKPAVHPAPFDCRRIPSVSHCSCSSLISSFNFEIPCLSTKQAMNRHRQRTERGQVTARRLPVMSAAFSACRRLIRDA